uniref:Uncharacterized protein n=1 Tax=Ascaris lumbricoides TaxID=6252 RepID=A0A0M3IW91_ASCLU
MLSHIGTDDKAYFSTAVPSVHIPSWFVRTARSLRSDGTRCDCHHNRHAFLQSIVEKKRREPDGSFTQTVGQLNTGLVKTHQYHRLNMHHG